jgi:hypothetical protein
VKTRGLSFAGGRSSLSRGVTLRLASGRTIRATSRRSRGALVITLGGPGATHLSLDLSAPALVFSRGLLTSLTGRHRASVALGLTITDAAGASTARSATLRT